MPSDHFTYEPPKTRDKSISIGLKRMDMTSSSLYGPGSSSLFWQDGSCSLRTPLYVSGDVFG